MQLSQLNKSCGMVTLNTVASPSEFPEVTNMYEIIRSFALITQVETTTTSTIKA